MKKEILISLALLVFGLVCEFFYLSTENIYWEVKFFLIGALSILVGMIGLLIFVILPFINKRLASIIN